METTKRFPKNKGGFINHYIINDDEVRSLYAEGYRKAEKDLALTWEDMKLIDELFTEMAFSEPNDSTEWYQELANRFNSQREKK